MSQSVTLGKHEKWRATLNVVSQNVNMPPRIAATEQKLAAAQRLVATRKALGLSQQDFAAAMGVGRTAYTNWESAERSIDPHAVARLWEVYGVTLDWIFRGDMSGLRHSLAVRLQPLSSASSRGGA